MVILKKSMKIALMRVFKPLLDIIEWKKFFFPKQIVLLLFIKFQLTITTNDRVVY